MLNVSKLVNLVEGFNVKCLNNWSNWLGNLTELGTFGIF